MTINNEQFLEELLMSDKFVCHYTIPPNFFAKQVFNIKLPANYTYEDFLQFWHNQGLEDLWDYAVDDIEDALENNEHLVAIEFYSINGPVIRVFEITETMVLCLSVSCPNN